MTNRKYVKLRRRASRKTEQSRPAKEQLIALAKSLLNPIKGRRRWTADMRGRLNIRVHLIPGEEQKRDISMRFFYQKSLPDSKNETVERLQDPSWVSSFKQTASNILGHEINRIDISLEPIEVSTSREPGQVIFLSSHSSDAAFSLLNRGAKTWDVCRFGRQYLIEGIEPSTSDNTLQQRSHWREYIFGYAFRPLL